MKIKRITSLLLAVLFCVSLCGCQPTPDKPVVQSKGDGELEDKISQPALPEQAYSAPETFKSSFETKDGTVTVNIDANVVVPDTLKIPVARIEKRVLTEEWTRDILMRLSVDGKLYDYQDELTYTKPQIEGYIQDLMDFIEELHESPDFADHTEAEIQAETERINEQIQEWQALYKTAPEEFTASEIDVRFEDPVSGPPALFACETAVEGGMAWFMFNKTLYDEGGSVEMFVNTPSTGWVYEQSYDLDNMNGITATPDEAVEIGKRFIEKMGESGFEASLVTAGYMNVGEGNSDNDPQCYDIFFTRSVEGVKTSYHTDKYFGSQAPASTTQFNGLDGAADIPSDFTDPDTNQYAPFWPQEYIELFITDQGVFKMHWEMPSMQTDVVNENVELLPFDEIQRIFEQQMGVSGSFTGSYTGGNIIRRDITITRIELGMTQIREKNTYAGLIMVPTWNFYGYETYTCEEQVEQGYDLDENNQFVNDELFGHSFMTINAVDGSIVNWELGY